MTDEYRDPNAPTPVGGEGPNQPVRPLTVAMPVHPHAQCSSGHVITPQDVAISQGWLLPCGCPLASAEGRAAEGITEPFVVPSDVS